MVVLYSPPLIRYSPLSVYMVFLSLYGIPLNMVVLYSPPLTLWSSHYIVFRPLYDSLSLYMDLLSLQYMVFLSHFMVLSIYGHSLTIWCSLILYSPFLYMVFLSIWYSSLYGILLYMVFFSLHGSSL